MADSFLPTTYADHPTLLLPGTYNKNALSIPMTTTAVFKIDTKHRGHEVPYRVFHMEERGVYLAFYKATKGMYLEIPRIYIIDDKTKTVITSYGYHVNLCPMHTEGDEVIDFCVHYTPYDILEFSLMVMNVEKRGVYVVRFRLDFFQIMHRQLPGDGDTDLMLDDVCFVADVLAPGKIDSEWIADYYIHYFYSIGCPVPYIEKLIPDLMAQYYFGELTPRYSFMTCMENGKYFFLVGHRMSHIYLTPHLPYPVDIQHVFEMDMGGMVGHKMLLGPLTDTLAFDEHTEGQAYATCLNVWDGRHLIVLDERKMRYLKIWYNQVDNGPIYDPVGFAAWEGGYIADTYYPPMVGWTNVSPHCNKWGPNMIFEPQFREATWRTIDHCTVQSARDGLDTLGEWENVMFNVFPDKKEWKVPIDEDDPSTQGDPPNTIDKFREFSELINIPTFCNDSLVYTSGETVIHNKADRLVFLDVPYDGGGIAQDSIYVGNLLPGETYQIKYYLKNMSKTSYLSSMALTIKEEDVPPGLTLEILGFPPRLDPWGEMELTVVVMYEPPPDTPPVYYMSIPLTTTYYVAYSTYCMPREEESPFPKDPGNMYAWGNNVKSHLGFSMAENAKVTVVELPMIVPEYTFSKGVGSVENAIALGIDGYLYTVGDNKLGQLGHGDRLYRDKFTKVESTDVFKDIAIGYQYMLALSVDGTLYHAGKNIYDLDSNESYGKFTKISDKKFTKISAGYEHILAIEKGTNDLYAGGANQRGQLGLGKTSKSEPVTKVPNVKAYGIAAGNVASLVLELKTKHLYLSGYFVGLRGTQDSNVFIEVIDMPYEQVSVNISGNQAVFLIDPDRRLFFFGSNLLGAGGLNIATTIHDPTPVLPDKRWLSASSSGVHSVALDTDGGLYTTGQASALGVLGNTLTKPYQMEFIRIDGASYVYASAFSIYGASFAIRGVPETPAYSLTLCATGDNTMGQLGIPEEGA